MTLTGYRITCNAVGPSPFAHDELAFSFSSGRTGWVNVRAGKKGEWGYHPGTRRWSYNQAPSTDATVVAQIVNAISQWERESRGVTSPAVSKSIIAQCEEITSIPMDENGEY